MGWPPSLIVLPEQIGTVPLSAVGSRIGFKRTPATAGITASVFTRRLPVWRKSNVDHSNAPGTERSLYPISPGRWKRDKLLRPGHGFSQFFKHSGQSGPMAVAATPATCRGLPDLTRAAAISERYLFRSVSLENEHFSRGLAGRLLIRLTSAASEPERGEASLEVAQVSNTSCKLDHWKPSLSFSGRWKKLQQPAISSKQ